MILIVLLGVNHALVGSCYEKSMGFTTCEGEQCKQKPTTPGQKQHSLRSLKTLWPTLELKHGNINGFNVRSTA